MSTLTASQAARLVEIALKNTILLGVGQRIGPSGANTPFATTTAIKAYSTSILRGDELGFVSSKGVTYQFSRTSTASDDGDTTLAPNDAGTAGRWLKTTSTVSSGYAKQVRVHTGNDTFRGMLMKANAVRPSIHILFDTVQSISRSLSRGALYSMVGKWNVRVIGSNLRPQAQAIEGSDVATETDPGTHQMIGDLIANLAGSQLNQTGVVYTEIGEERYVESPEEGRLFVEEMPITVFYTVHQPDTDAVTIDGLSGIYLQRQLLGGGQPYDATNVVTSGYTIPIGSGFNKTPVPGVAVIGGTATSSSPASFTFAANSDTYRDLHTDGTFSYTAVANGRPAPNIVYTGAKANTLRVAVTVTDGSGVIYDAMLAGSLENYRAVDILPGAGLGVVSIAITPTTATITSGQTQKFTATGTYSDGHTADISTVVTWNSSNTPAATIDYTGLASWVATGSSTISCSLDGLAAGNTATLTTS